MQISWVLLAENVAVNENLQRIDILGEFRSMVADHLPYSMPKFYVVCRAEADAHDQANLPYKLTLRKPSNEEVELHNSDVSVTFPPKAEHVIGTLIAEIQEFEFTNYGMYSITARLGDSVYSADFMVIPQRTVANDTQE